jgi:hypothetical protein
MTGTIMRKKGAKMNDCKNCMHKNKNEEDEPCVTCWYNLNWEPTNWEPKGTICTICKKELNPHEGVKCPLCKKHVHPMCFNDKKNLCDNCAKYKELIKAFFD